MLDSLERPADTPQVREALDLLERFASPEYSIRNFRNALSHPQRARATKTEDRELERLSAELEGLPLKWAFIPRSSQH